MTNLSLEYWVEYLLENIPLTRAMQIKAGILSPDGLSLRAPLLPNHNDKGTAFGGTLATLCTLSGWAMVSQICHSANQNVDIVVVKSNIRYLRPVHDNTIEAFADCPEEASQKTFIECLKVENWAKLEIHCRVFSGSQKAVEFSGEYGARLGATPSK